MEAIVSGYCCGGDVVDVALSYRWFNMYSDPDTKTSYYKFNGKYWDCKLRGDWVDCPDIF